MKKISFVRFRYTPYGGAENYLTRLCEALTREDIEFEILSSNNYGKKTIQLEIPSFLPSFLKISSFAQRVQEYAKSQKSFLFSLERIESPDIYRAGDGVHREWLSIKEGASGPFQKIAVWFKPLNHTYLALEEKTFHNAKLIIANSERVKQDIIRHYKIPEKKIEVIYNGVEKQLVSREESSHSLRQEFGIPEKSPVILFVGSGFERKGVKYLLKILSRLSTTNYRVLIVGKEKRLSYYENLAKRLKVSKRILFTGPRKDIARFYAGSDLFVFPTMYEPFSNACLEAMVHGCPVITTRNNGIAELIPNRMMVMNHYQDYSIYRQIDTLLKHPDELEKERMDQQELASKLTLERNFKLTLKAIKKVLGENPA